VEHCKMPKIKKSLSSTLNAWVDVYNDFTTDGQVLFCKYCEVVVSSSEKFQVQQHIQTAKHAMKKEAKTSAKTGTAPHNIFNQDLCRALVSADIPLNKLNNKELVSFLEKYTDQKVPSESTLRKNYVPDLYNETLDRLREKVLDKVNHSTMAAFFTDSLGLLWVDGIKYDRVLLVCTDAAPYMIKCMAGLEILFPKKIHVTCLAHGLHRVAELARAVMPDVNVLISTVKKVFLKASSRKERFRQIAGTVPLPPSPVVTRWGTWIEAALYYADNFETVNICTYCMKEAQNALKKDGLREDLIFIRANLACISSAILNLEKKGLTLKSSMDVVQGVVDSLSHLEKKDYFEKISQVLAKNKGYSRLKKI
ncbi:CGG triplet repeat-binding protein 1-like 3, partial [Homarus americanus]